jgi:DNA-directed RNA polymerase subunit beta
LRSTPAPRWFPRAAAWSTWSTRAAWWCGCTMTETATGDVGVDIYNLTKYTRSNQNTNINQRPLVTSRRRHRPRRRGRRRRVHRPGRAGARPEHAGRVHAVERLQLRGLDPDHRSAWSPKTAYTSIHIEELTVVARDTKLGRRRSPATSPTSVRGAAVAPRRVGHRLHRRRGRGRRRAGRQGDAEGRDAADAGGEAAARDLRREGLRREGHVRCACRPASRAPSSTSRCSRARASSATSAPSRSSTTSSSATRRTSTTSCASSRNDTFARSRSCLLIGKTANGGPKKLAKGTKITKATTSTSVEPPRLVRHPPRRRGTAARSARGAEGVLARKLRESSTRCSSSRRRS